MKTDAKRSLALLGAVLLAALGLRLFHLQQRVLWFDEANSLLIAKAVPARIIDAVLDDTHSPFYYLVLRYWLFVAGGEAGARLLSVLAGVATVAVGGDHDLAGVNGGVVYDISGHGSSI